jgi:hypothetical protein
MKLDINNKQGSVTRSKLVDFEDQEQQTTFTDINTSSSNNDNRRSTIGLGSNIGTARSIDRDRTWTMEQEVDITN